MFDDSELVEKYGSWVRVQVAFYDFIFEEGTKLCSAHWGEEALTELAKGEYKDGSDFYERSIRQIEEAFTNFDEARAKFIKTQE